MMCPKISIITVSLNSERTIDRTIKSVVSQDYSNYEYIVIDGASTDSTCDILASYGTKITKWISEKDKGIFDAMNKGAKIASGDYLYFLNSDDFLLDTDVLTLISKELNDKNGVFYGNIKSLNSDGQLYNCPTRQSVSHISQFYNLPVHHPGSVISKKLFDSLNGYDTQYKFSSDYDLFLRCFLQGCNFQKIDFYWSCMIEGGTGTININKSMSEFILSLKNNRIGCYVRFMVYIRWFWIFLILHFSLLKKMHQVSRVIRFGKSK